MPDIPPRKKRLLVEKMEMEKVEDIGQSELVLVCHCIAMYTAGPGLQILTRLSRLFRSYNATIMDHNSSTRHMALLRFWVNHLKDRHSKAPVVKLLVDCC